MGHLGKKPGVGALWGMAMGLVASNGEAIWLKGMYGTCKHGHSISSQFSLCYLMLLE